MGTPISKALGSGGVIAQNISDSSNIQQTMDEFDFHKKKPQRRLAADAIYGQVDRLYADAVTLNVAGVKHYDNLLLNYKEAMSKVASASDFFNIEAALIDARTKWSSNRSALLTLLDTFKHETKKDFPKVV